MSGSNARWRDWLRNALVQMGVGCDESHANFILARFASPAEAEDLMVMAQRLMGAAEAQALFQETARAQGKDIPSVTINLEGDVAIELAKGGMIKGLASQVPYDQGITEANAAMGSLLGKELPPFLAYAAVPVIQNNVLQAWDTVFHLPVPDDLKEACDSNPVCAGK